MASEVKWGRNGTLWGLEGVTWGSDHLPPPEEDQRLLHSLVDVYHSADPFHVWSGYADFTFEGDEYWATRGLLDVSDILSTISTSGDRGSIRVRARAPSNDGVDQLLPIRTLLLSESIWPMPVRIRYIVSDDSGQTWRALRNSTRGRISQPTYDGDSGSFSMQIVDADVLAYRADQLLWSHEAHTINYPKDFGFEFMRELATDYSVHFPDKIRQE